MEYFMGYQYIVGDDSTGNEAWLILGNYALEHMFEL